MNHTGDGNDWNSLLIRNQSNDWASIGESSSSMILEDFGAYGPKKTERQ